MRFFKKFILGYYENYDDFSAHKSFIALNLLSILGFLFHFIYFIYFKYANFQVATYLNVFSSCIYIFLFLLNRNKKFNAVSDIITIEILTYSVLLSYFIGTEVFPLGLILLSLLPHFLFLESSLNKKLFYSFLSYIAFILAYFIFDAPISKESISKLFIFFNSNAIFIAILLELNFSSFIENVVKDSYEKTLKIAKEEAFIDPLTKLYNRRYFDKYSKDMKSEANKDVKFCIAIIDIDFFKKVNDTYGHSFGDQVLINLSSQMMKNFRNYDTIFRFGGEEFLIVFRNADIYEAQTYVERFRTNFVNSQIKYKDTEVNITFTTGICEYDKNMDLSKCIETADKRLYYGKNNGRDRVVISIPE